MFDNVGQCLTMLDNSQQIETRRTELENLKRERTEAKLEADNTKSENKKELLEMEKQRLNIANMVTAMKVINRSKDYTKDNITTTKKRINNNCLFRLYKLPWVVWEDDLKIWPLETVFSCAAQRGD
jgi:hypothetical protein